jgi:hypothetical protein
MEDFYDFRLYLNFRLFLNFRVRIKMELKMVLCAHAYLSVNNILEFQFYRYGFSIWSHYIKL